LIIFFFLGIIGARSAVRLIMGLSPAVAGIVGFFSVYIVMKTAKQKEGSLKLFLYVAALVVIVAGLYSFYFNYQLTIGSAKSMVPSYYTYQWQKAMAWVRNNTPKNAVFAHWWDYGYWVQTIGNRATILDGGNSISYWDHLLGRHVLCGQTEREALEFLYAHNATYLLIDSTEIGKYTAYSSIGSDENYDRYSQLPIFSEDEKSMREMKNETLHLYVGSMFVDEDYLWKKEGKEEFLPAYRAGIGGVFLVKDKEGEIKKAEAIFIYQGKQINIPLRYVYRKGKLYDFREGYGGCLYILPVIANGNTIKEEGRALFITEKSMRALWIKLYLFDNGKNFELVHKEDNLIIESLKMQGVNVSDFIVYSGFQGPIKIWKINYPKDIEFKREYLETEYPESVKYSTGFF